MLSHLTGSWCPQAFTVSFKVCQEQCGVACIQSMTPFYTQLETDEKLVIPNAKKSIVKYGVQVRKEVAACACAWATCHECNRLFSCMSILF